MRGMYRGQTLQVRGMYRGQTEVNFNFGQGYTLRQSDIVDYRAAYFAAKNLSKPSQKASDLSMIDWLGPIISI